MNLTIEVEGCERAGRPTALISLKGELDAYTSLELREECVRRHEGGVVDCIIDLSGVDFIDSVGLGTLVGCFKRAAKHGGSVDLICCDASILDVFDVTGLSKTFDIYFSKWQAVCQDGVKQNRVVHRGVHGGRVRLALHRESLGLSLSRFNSGGGTIWVFSLEMDCSADRVDDASAVVLNWATQYAQEHGTLAELSLPSAEELAAIFSRALGARVTVQIMLPKPYPYPA